MADPKHDPYSVCRVDPYYYGSVVLLDAVQTGPQARLFFSHDTDFAEIQPHKSVKVEAAGTLGDAPVLVVGDHTPDTPVALKLGTLPANVTPRPSETDLFKGLNTALGVRNGEGAAVVLDWLDYHARNHGLEAALILSRARPDTDWAFHSAMREGLAERMPDLRVVMVEVDHPLGQTDKPAEAHPFNVPESPGKDRMTDLTHDVWTSPLGAVVLYEWAKARFLSEARAVLNLEVHDLLVPEDGPNVFDRAVQSESGYIELHGRHCYPWRVRKGDEAHFADHICVQFDNARGRRRWCVAPAKLPEKSVWRQIRVGGATLDDSHHPTFYRFMALRHPTEAVSKIVPKTSLIEHPALMAFMAAHFDHDPVRMPEERLDVETNGRRAIVTTMKNEGPFILEWIAYHRAIGVHDFLVYTNDCTDGTDTMLDLLQEKGFVQHRDNPFKQTDLKPQHAALQAAESEPTIMDAEWAICMDVDEFITVKCGDGTLDALFGVLDDDVNMVSLTWRLFGNADIHEYVDRPMIEQFTRCAPEFANKPHQAWGFKTLFKNIGLYKKLGVHRPKGLKPQLWDRVKWVNGSGTYMPREMYRNAWRSTSSTYGYDLVQLNHYAVRCAESFLVKRDRGRVNHVDRDQGLAYWFRMNNNAVEETSIQRLIPAMRAELDAMLADPDIRAAHDYSVTRHREKIDELRATENYSNFYAELTGERMERLSKMHHFFGANVFLQGPESVPDDVVFADHPDDFFFTVEDVDEAVH